jgi:hypothetical protein
VKPILVVASVKSTPGQLLSRNNDAKRQRGLLVGHTG